MIYQYTAKKSNGEEINFSDYKGKVLIIVNTATKCGLAPQFKGLETLYQQYKSKGLVIIGFPCDQFRGQEPESDESMQQVCEINFGVTFPLTKKSDVNGPNTHPIFQYLKSELSGFLTNKIKWNFTKFVIDKNGKPVKRFAPTSSPLKMEKLIKSLLDS